MCVLSLTCFVHIGFPSFVGFDGILFSFNSSFLIFFLFCDVVVVFARNLYSFKKKLGYYILYAPPSVCLTSSYVSISSMSAIEPMNKEVF